MHRPQAVPLPSDLPDARVITLIDAAHRPITLSDALVRAAEAEDTLRAIAAGEVDAFAVSDGGSGRRIFTLSTADRPYRMFVENMRDGAATLSSRGIILYANRRLAELLSHDRETIVGSALATFVADDAAVGPEDLYGLSGLGASVELDLIDANGDRAPVLVGASRLDMDGEQLTCLTFADLSAQRAQDREIARLGNAQAARMADLQDAQAALTKQATHDALTGLPNRAVLVDRIDQALSHSTRSRRCTAVYFVDLDRFKQVNDTQGHAAGDNVLRRVAEVLSPRASHGHRRTHRRGRVRRPRFRCRQPGARGRHRQPSAQRVARPHRRP
jgi:PAS domain S-box-containing protein